MTHTIAPPTLEELNKRIAAIEDIRNTWLDLPSKTPFDLELYCLYAVRDGVGAKRQTELEDANNACIELAAKHGYATGHGDTVGDIMREFNAQIPDRAQSPWMGIETAPKDGTDIIVYRPTQTFGEHIPKVGIDYWMTEKSYGPCWAKSNADCQPTHWMPLPAPPTHNSPPDVSTSHNHGEGDPSVMPDSSGGEQ
jgi:hypothetical protein